MEWIWPSGCNLFTTALKVKSGTTFLSFPLVSAFLLFVLIFLKTGVQWLYSIVLVSAIQWSESDIYIYIYTHTQAHISPLSWTSFPLSPPNSPRSSQNTGLGSLCYIISFHQLSILHMVVYILISISQSILPTFTCHHIHKSVLCICISIPALQISSSVLFF